LEEMLKKGVSAGGTQSSFLSIHYRKWCFCMIGSERSERSKILEGGGLAAG